MEDMEEKKFVVTTFYKFIEFEDCYDLRAKLLKFCLDNKVRGTILLATEGINGTICSTHETIDKFYAFIKELPEIADLVFKESFLSYHLFRKMIVKVKKEIVTFKVEGLDMSNTGVRLNSDEWDELLSNKDTLLIDTRNDYEIPFGTFVNAIDPKTKNFSDFPAWAEQNLANTDREKPIAMCCTGGVRCEKSTAYLKQKLGFKNVYHLKDGILKYLEDRRGKESLWQGDCFVFDYRLAVDNNLNAIEEIDE